MALAQANVSKLRAPLHAPESRGFVTALEPIHRLAEASPGFVWRLESEHGHATVESVWNDALVLVNVSVWEDYASLHDFVYRSAHAGYLKNARRWFAPVMGEKTVLWWVAAGERPTLESALARLRLLNRYGPTPRAFSPRRQFDASGRRAIRRTTATARSSSSSVL
jgi:hypothetical protein